jgi:hypothetical protein
MVRAWPGILPSLRCVRCAVAADDSEANGMRRTCMDLGLQRRVDGGVARAIA